MDSNRDYRASIKLLERLVTVSTYTENKEGCAHALKIFEQAFHPLKGSVKWLRLKDACHYNQEGKKVRVPLSPALVIQKRKKAPFQIYFGGHIDTVFPELWPLKKISSSKWTGPGVTDMKGGLVVLWQTLQALENSPLRDQFGWRVLINPDEESGSHSSEPWIRHYAQGADVAVHFEPALEDGAIVSERKGSSNITLIAKGKTAHAGRNIEHGRNAIASLARILVQLGRLPYHLNAGEMHGGKSFNVVPDHALLKINIRVDTSKEFEQFLTHLSALSEKEKEQGIEITLFQNSLRAPKSKDVKLFQVLEEAGRELKIPIHTRKSGGVSDGNITHCIGIPTIDTLGVRGGGIHTEGEFILLDSIKERSALACLFLQKLIEKGTHAKK